MAKTTKGDYFTPELCAWLALRFLGGDIDEEECNKWLDTSVKADLRVTEADLETQRRRIETNGFKMLDKVTRQREAAFKLIESPSGRGAVRYAMSHTTRENLFELLGLERC